MRRSRQLTNVRGAAMNGKPTVISVFAGCGGSSLGYKLAGYRELLAVDWNGIAADTFKLNFTDVPSWVRDVRTVTVEEVLNFCGLVPGELDVFDGSPPCQGFSMSGRREVNDSRNDLFLEYIRLINGLKPKVFLMENVPGMVKGKMKGRFIDILKSLKTLDYRVKCKQMNAKYYGVAQSRERLIFIGVRNDLNIEPSFPKGCGRVVSVGKALEGFNCAEQVVYPKGKARDYYYAIPPGKSLAHFMTKKFGINSYFNLIKADPKRPLCTITRLFAEGMSGILHWKERRFLTIGELKRLASFPDDFQFAGTFKEQWAQIGNAVMPKFMCAVAEHIKREILEKEGTE